MQELAVLFPESDTLFQQLYTRGLNMRFGAQGLFPDQTDSQSLGLLYQAINLYESGYHPKEATVTYYQLAYHLRAMQQNSGAEGAFLET